MRCVEEIIQDQKYFRKIDKRKLQANEQELRRDLKNGGKKLFNLNQTNSRGKNKKEQKRKKDEQNNRY